MKIVISTTIKKPLDVIERPVKDATDARRIVEKAKADGGFWVDYRVVDVLGTKTITHHDIWIPYHSIQCISYPLN
jgi:hypothetical protein